MTRRYTDPWSRTDLAPREEPAACADCGRRIRPDWTRCRPCFTEHLRRTSAEPATPPPGSWPLCRLCGATRPTFPLRHAPSCAVIRFAGTTGTNP